jgi:hypothetical protein
MVAVRMTLATNRTAKVAANPTTVRRALRARMTNTHVFDAARCRR